MTPQQSAGQEYLSYLKDKDSTFEMAGDGNLLTAGQAICDGFDAGLSVETLLLAVKDSGLTQNQITYIFAGAVFHLCPEYSDRFKANSVT